MHRTKLVLALIKLCFGGDLQQIMTFIPWLFLTGMRETIMQIPNHPILEPDYVARGFMQLVEDGKLNGAVMRITPQKGIEFHDTRRSSRRKTTSTDTGGNSQSKL